MRNRTVRARVTLAAIGVLAGGLVVLCLGINLLLAQQLRSDASAALRNRVAAQLATLAVTRSGIRIVEHRNDAALDQHSWVFGSDGHRIEQAPGQPAVQRAVSALAAVDTPAEREVAGIVRLRAVPVRGPDRLRAGTVVVGVSLVPYNHSRTIALLGTIALSLLLLVLGALAVRRAVGSALGPVAEMTERAAQWGEQDLHRRFAVGPPRDELATLAATFNGLLGRIEGVLRHEQRLTAEMAHELRTPLTGLRTEAELALKSGEGDGELRAALARVVAGTERMASVIETLLSSARSGGSRPEGSSDPAAAVEQAAAGIRPAAAQRGVAIEVAASHGSVQAPADVVAHALSPLLENAVRHTATRVCVSTIEDEGELAVVVQDDGSGFSSADAESLFAPGLSTTGGAGLGLSLSRRLARSCGGDVVAVPDPHGGRFELRLPSAGTSAS